MRVSFGRNVLASVFNAGTVILTALASVPLILGRVGPAGYGIWTLAVTTVTYIAIVETGIGPAVQRFVAVARGRGAHEELARLLWSTVLAYTAFALAGFVALRLLAGPIVDVFDVPRALRGDAEAMFRVVGIGLGLALLNAGTGNVLMGLERFPRLAVAAGTGSLAFLVAVLVLLRAGGGGLADLAWALVVQQAVGLVMRLWFLRDVLASGFGLVDRVRLRELAGFSVRLQATVFTELFNWQSDKVVVGLVAPPGTLGQLGIGSQLADGGRLLGGAALNPVYAHLAVLAGTGDRAELDRRFHALNRLWLVVACGTTVIAAGTIHGLVESWLGPRYGLGAVLGTLLVVGSGCGLVPGVGAAYMRAIGRPGLEARYGLTILVLNLALTILLSLTVGAVGVVAGTCAAYAAGLVYFMVHLNRVIPLAGPRTLPEAVRALVLALVAAAASALWAEVIAALLPAGWAVVIVLAGLGAALVGFALAALRVRPTRAALGQLADALRAPEPQRSP